MKDPLQTSFLGIGWGFPPEFEPQVGVLVSAEEQDVRESLHILFQTARGERLFAPKYGLELRSLCFDSIGTTMKTLLEDQIRRSILIWEPRITVLRLSLDTSAQVLEGKVVLDVDYSIKATNSRFNLVFPFYASDASEIAGVR